MGLTGQRLVHQERPHRPAVQFRFLLVAAWPVIRAVGSKLVVVGASRGLRATLVGLGILAALIVVVVILPPLFVSSLGNLTSQTTAENAVRTTLLQGVGCRNSDLVAGLRSGGRVGTVTLP